MKILHIINDRFTDLTRQIIDIQSENNEIKVVELSKKKISYKAVIDDIFSHDKVISW